MKLFKVGDKVRHENFPEIIYEVKLEFLDGSYRIEPLNADIGKAITYATKEKMTLIKEG